MFLRSIQKKKNKLVNKWRDVKYINSSFCEKLRFSKFKRFSSMSAFGQLQLAPVSLGLETSFSNLKIRDLGKNCVRLFFIYDLFLCFVVIFNRIAPSFM